MKPVRRTDKSGYIFNARPWRILLALAFALLLSFASASASPAPAPASPASIYEKRTEAEQASRYVYRRLEITSLVVMLVAGACTAYWLFRRRKP